MLRVKHKLPVDRLAARQVRLWERTHVDFRKRQVQENPPCITISKEVGTTALDLAKRLAERLGWRWFDRELVEFIAGNARVRKSMVEMFDQKLQGEIHDWVLTLLDNYALGSDRYFKHLATVITSIGSQGYAVILGRGGNFILRPEQTLRIKIVAPLEMRVRHVMDSSGLAKADARRLVLNSDKEREAFIRRLFHREAENPLGYDVTLNMDGLSLQAAEEIILSAMRCKFPAAVLDSAKL